MTINGTLVISKTPPLIAKEGVVWIDTSTQIPRIKYFSGGGYIPLNDIPDLPIIPEAPTWDSLEGKPEVIAAGETQEEARSAIGAGTGNSNLALGTTATTAKAGNYQPTWAQVTGKPTTFTPSTHTHAWADITSKPTVIASGATQAEARTAIGAGTGNSNLAIGTTAATAAAGNHNHAVTAHSESGLVAASNIQALAQALSTRIKALEDAQTTPEG